MPKPIENILAPSFVKRAGLWAIAVKNNAVATLADLRALDGEAVNEPAHVPGVSGGVFLWSSDTTTPHDGISCYAKASSRVGAWMRVYDGDIAPEWSELWDEDDTYPAIQAALDYSRPVDGGTPIGKRVRLSKRDYPVSRPPAVYTGTQLVGEGPASNIVAREDFVGSGLIVGGRASATTTAYLESITIRDIGFDPGSMAGLWAIDLSNIEDILHATIDGIWQWTAKGLNLSSYLQHSYISRIISFGDCDQILWVKGNHNTFAHINKERGTGTTSDPYILIEEHAEGRSQSNNFRHVLIEGTTSVNKPGFKAAGTYDLTMQDVWVEPTLTDGHAVLLDDCKRYALKGSQTHMTSTYSGWRIQNGSYGQIEEIDADAEDVPWQDVFSIDDTSSITCPHIYSRRATNAYPIDTGHRIRVGTHIARTRITTPAAGYSPISRARNSPPTNLAKNGSFEAGDYEWGKWGGAGSYGATQSFPASEVGPGLMCQFDTFTGASQGIVQSRSISAAQVGHPITLAALVQLTGTGYVCPHFNGAGVTLDTECQRVQATTDWCLMTATVVPTAAGSLEFGVAWRGCDGSSIVKIDMLSLVFGDEGVPMHDSYQQVERGGNTIVYGVTAAPNTGTWKRGDEAWRSDPSAGQPLGWICMAAGSPGTWCAIGGGASLQSTPADPTGTTNTAGKMAGLAGSITPTMSGKLLITVSGDLTNSSASAGYGCTTQLRYGTGSAPANGDALTGTAIGSLVSAYLQRAAADLVPFSCNAVVTGLTVGTAYWIDLSEAAITGGTGQLKNVSISVVEVP